MAKKTVFDKILELLEQTRLENPDHEDIIDNSENLDESNLTIYHAWKSFPPTYTTPEATEENPDPLPFRNVKLCMERIIVDSGAGRYTRERFFPNENQNFVFDWENRENLFTS